MRKTKDNRTGKPRRALARGANRFAALLLAAALLLSGGIVLPQRAEAATYGDLSGSLTDNTYALQISTGTVSASGNLADEILYFKITYTDTDGYTRSHLIFPGENALQDSVSWANSVGSESVKTNNRILTMYTKLGVAAAPVTVGFQSYATDTYFFQPLKPVKSIQSVEMLMCDRQTTVSGSTSDDDPDRQTTAGTKSSGGSWHCQALRVYQVSAVRGMKPYGYLTNKQYADFDGTLVAQMDKSHTFSWTTDKMFRITASGGGDGVLQQVNESYSTQTDGRILRIDIADTYGAGIRAMGNNTAKSIAASDFDECAAIVLRYRDIYGALREAAVPMMASAVGYALENGISQDQLVSGLGQDGQTLAVKAELPDVQSVETVRIVYGTEAAKAAAGITVTHSSTDASAQDRTVAPDGTEGVTTDLLSITGFSVYNTASASVSHTVADTMLQVTFNGTPESYYRAPSAAGMTIRPVAKGSSGTEITLQAYSDGARLLPADNADRYLVVLNTDESELAGTTGNIAIALSYTDLSGKAQSSETIDVSDAVTQYYGEWPGVSTGFMYRAGVKSGGTLCFLVSLKDVDKFTGAKLLVRGSTDDWQMKGIELYKLDELGTLRGEWKTVTDGTETSDRTYYRDYSGKKLLGLNQSVLVDGGQDATTIEFNSDDTATVDTDTGDWSDSRYSMTYETAQSLARFAKARYSYTVAVEVGDDQTSVGGEGNCGSKNQFFFQLVFEDGKSAYVLANQQLASDGFRSGYTEQFTISTNRDMGELTAVKILPEDTADSSDVFDKLKIDSICVKKQSSEAVSRQWVISNVGWIDINYKDDDADGSNGDSKGRSEADIVKTYQVEASTYAVNLEFAITTGAYNTSANTNTTEPQFVGQVNAIVEYYNSNGALKTASYNLVEAMYAYAGQERKSGQSEVIGQYLWPGGTESDPSFMFRAGKTDRFNLAIEDVAQILRVTLEVRSKTQTTWNIENMYVSLAGSGGRRIINTENEYQWLYTKETEQLCSSTSSGEKAYSINLPINQMQTINIDFTENNIKWSQSAQNIISSVTTRQPTSSDDTLNIYVYPLQTAASSSLSGVTMKAGAQYSRVYNGFNRIETTMTLGENNGKPIFYATGVPASGISTLNKLELYATFDDLNATGQVMLDYAVVQQVRSGVVINSYYINFSGCDAAADSRGVSRAPTSNQVESAQSRQTVTLYFASDMATMQLIQGTEDVAVSLLYTTTNDVYEREYESSAVYLTEQSVTELRAGSVAELTFNESNVKEVTGIRIRGTGPTTRSGVGVASAVVTRYETDSSGSGEYVAGSTVFNNAVKLTAGQSNQIMRTPQTSAVQVTLTATTTPPGAATAETIVVASGETKRQLVESGQEVVITPTVTGSTKGFTYSVEKFRDDFTSAATGVVTRSDNDGTLTFKATNEYSSGTGTEVYYRVTVISSEDSSVQAVMEFAVEPKYAASSETDTSASAETTA